LQIAFNRPLREIGQMVNSLPLSDRIIIEVGYPLIKTYGVHAVSVVKNLWDRKLLGTILPHSKQETKPLPLEAQIFKYLFTSPKAKDVIQNKKGNLESTKNIFLPYIVADLKCMDRAFVEVGAAARAGASAATCLGLAPVETINEFIKKCNEINVDSFLDMMNVEYPFEVLSKLSALPKVVMLHRGVDENENNKDKDIPLHEIERIKNAYDNILIAVAGGETTREVMSVAFNGADIVVVWRQINEGRSDIANLTKEFLKEIE